MAMCQPHKFIAAKTGLHTSLQMLPATAYQVNACPNKLGNYSRLSSRSPQIGATNNSNAILRVAFKNFLLKLRRLACLP